MDIIDLDTAMGQMSLQPQTVQQPQDIQTQAWFVGKHKVLNLSNNPDSFVPLQDNLEEYLWFNAPAGTMQFAQMLANEVNDSQLEILEFTWQYHPTNQDFQWAYHIRSPHLANELPSVAQVLDALVAYRLGYLFEVQGVQNILQVQSSGTTVNVQATLTEEQVQEDLSMLVNN